MALVDSTSPASLALPGMCWGLVTMWVLHSSYSSCAKFEFEGSVHIMRDNDRIEISTLCVATATSYYLRQCCLEQVCVSTGHLIDLLLW